MALTWYVDVDWNNDGVFEADEASRVMAIQITRGRPNRFEQAAQGQIKLARMKVGTCHVTLDNYDRRFEPWYASGALYPNVRPGRLFRVRVNDGSTTHNLFYGHIDAIEASPRDKMAEILASDLWRAASDQISHTDVNTTTANMGTWMHSLLPAAWSATHSDGDDIPYYFADGKALYDVLHELCEADGGAVWISGAGAVRFKSRADMLADNLDLSLTDAEVLKDLMNTSGWENIINDCVVKVSQRTIAGSSTMFTLPDTPSIAAGETAIFYCQYKDAKGRDCFSDPATTPTTVCTVRDPVNDITSSCTISITYLCNMEVVTIVNGANMTGYVTQLVITGKPLTIENQSQQQYRDSTSQSTYGKRTLLIDSLHQQTNDTAKILATMFVSRYLVARPALRVSLQARASTQFGYDLMSLVRYTSSYFGVDDAFRIGQIEHRSVKSMQDIVTTWSLEPTDTHYDFWEAGTIGQDALGSETIIGYTV